MSAACPVCGGSATREFFALKAVPVICNQLWPDADAAREAPAGDVDLNICDDCAMIWNAAFDPARMEYAPGYENALHFSPSFQKFADDLAARLVRSHNLEGKHVVEIGCGDGFMLDLMSAHGAATAVGFDPTMEGVETPYTAREGVEIVPEYFRSNQLDRHFDALLCRHVLEHVDTPLPLLTDIRRAVKPSVPIYFEVPNAGWMLDAVSMWDVIYEHVGYWTAPAMETLFRRAGFAPLRIESGYGEQFLLAEGAPSESQPEFLADPTGIVAAADRFKAAAERELSKWRSALSNTDRRAVIWGAGSKGITFANALGAPASDGLVGMVDLNPRKHGLFTPGIAIPVCAPDDLVDLDVDLILISNALYEDEIKAQVRDMGLAPEFGVIAG